MKNENKEIFIPGPSGRIQAKYYKSKQQGAPVALVLQPHPQYGGTMNNRIVYETYNCFFKNGFSIIRINFRGVEKSDGIFDNGQGELSDAAAALDWIEKENPGYSQCWVSGFSFGALICMQLIMRRPEVNKFITISPQPNLYDFSFLSPCPISGIVAALVGIIISPVSARLKGLNLGLVTLAIVFIGSHFFSNFKSITGGAGLGRKAAKLKFLGVDLDSGLTFGNIILEKNLIIYYFSLFLCVLLGIGAKNLTRTKIGRAFSAIRDRDIAAEALGINLFKYKMYAFALSSFYAGISGSLLFIISGGIEPGTFSLLYSITFIAIVIIGGVGTVLGPLYGAFFFTMLPGIIQNVLHLVGAADSGFFLNPGEIERIVFGFFIIFFLVVEPRGIWGIWFRLRNYFKAWPFSY